MSEAEAFFAQSYAEARAKFLAAAALLGAPVESLTHPRPGRDGESLTTDVLRLGPAEAEAVLLVTSGCHGVEGYCGSGVQGALLADAGLLRAAREAGVALLLVHALNPYGFSWWRRSTHENVDLNRNGHDYAAGFVPPANPAYEAIAAALVPDTWPPTAANEAVLAGFAAQHGARALQAAISGGQYTHPTGLFYGGTAPTWSAQAFDTLLASHATRCARLGWIDLHTGLGPQGHGEKIWGGPDDAVAIARGRAWWGPEVTSMHDGSSASAKLTGLLGEIAYRRCAQAVITPMALEYGTEPMDEVIGSLRAEAWLENHPQADEATRVAIKRRFRDAFYTDTPAWKAAIVEQGLLAVRQALTGLQTMS